MRPVHCALYPVIALVLTARPCPAQGQPTPQERERLRAAAEAFERGDFDPSAGALKDFLHDYPKSSLAPEAAFRLAAVYLLQGKCADAAQAQDRLVRDYYASPWTGLILGTQFDDKRLLALANEWRAKGRAENSNDDTAKAIRVYQLCLARCGEKGKQGGQAQNEAKEAAKEVLYKLGDCLRRLGQPAPFQAAMQQVQALDGTGQWGTLAAIRLGDAHTVQDRMDDLLNLHVADNEEAHAFLALADEHAAALDEAARVKCLYYRARCHNGLGQIDKTLALCQEVIAKHPQSPWAAEAAMYVAEHHFSKGDVAKAKGLYLDVAQKYPKSPRAAQAGAWADWLGDADKHWKDFEGLLAATALKASAGNGAFALRVRREGEGSKPFEGRLAFQDPQHYLLSLAVGPTEFLVARDKDACWYRLSDRPEVVRTKHGADLPIPQLVAADDGKLNFNWGFGSQALPQAGPPIQVSPKAVASLVGQWRQTAHLTKQPQPGTAGGVVYRLQQPSWAHPHLTDLEVEVEAGGKVQAVRLTTYTDKAEKSVWTVSDISLGGPLPGQTFSPGVQAGVTVREVEEMNPMEVFTGVMRLLGVLMGQPPNG